VPAEIDPDSIPSLKHLYEEAFRVHAASTAYSNMGRKLTYADVDEQSRRFGAWLQKVAGLRKGDRVAIMMPNVLQYPGRDRRVPPRRLHRRQRQPALHRARARAPVEGLGRCRDRDLRERGVDAAAGARAYVDQAHRRDGHRRPARISERPHHEFRDSQGQENGAGVCAARAVSFNDALTAGARHTLDRVDVSGEDVAFLQYTGGTTGVSKGAVLTHRNMVANTLQVVAFMPELGEVDDPAVITALPLYHIFALTTNMLVFTHVGGNNVLITNPRDMPGFVKELAKVRFTFITGVNTLFNALLHTPGFDKLDFRSLKVALGGGMAVQAAVSERWRKVTGRHICQGWGLTESSPVGTANLPRETEFSGSIGYPIPSTEISICDDVGNALPNGSSAKSASAARR
jgi:long-chain acyl-CoA synthetase